MPNGAFAVVGDRLAARSKESRMVGGSTDRDESEVAVTPNQSAPRWKVTTLTARGNWRRASSGAAGLRRNPIGGGGDDFERGALSHRTHHGQGLGISLLT